MMMPRAVSPDTQLVIAQRHNSGTNGLQRFHRTLPSKKRITREACWAICGSWVTTTMVLPWSLSFRNSAIISWADLLSKAPVGSSARIILGEHANALATATRCC